MRYFPVFMAPVLAFCPHSAFENNQQYEIGLNIFIINYI
jgi:hypothetical protein